MERRQEEKETGSYSAPANSPDAASPGSRKVKRFLNAADGAGGILGTEQTYAERTC